MAPGAMVDNEKWELTPVHRLTAGQVVNVLGRAMRVVRAAPAPRGGDFYRFEIQEHADSRLAGLVSIELDKNTRVPARLHD
jgi:hypothetical protein